MIMNLSSDRSRPLVSLVERMLALHKQLPDAGTPHEKTALQRQIEATDGQIDGGPALRADGRGDRDCGGEKPGYVLAKVFKPNLPEKLGAYV